MIQGFTETTINAFISTEDNRIDNSLAVGAAPGALVQLAFLVKFINDMDGSIQYCYPLITIYDRY